MESTRIWQAITNCASLSKLERTNPPCFPVFFLPRPPSPHPPQQPTPLCWCEDEGSILTSCPSNRSQILLAKSPPFWCSHSLTIYALQAFQAAKDLVFPDHLPCPQLSVYQAPSHLQPPLHDSDQVLTSCFPTATTTHNLVQSLDKES